MINRYLRELLSYAVFFKALFFPLNSSKEKVIFFGVNSWKHKFIKEYFITKECVFVPKRIPIICVVRLSQNRLYSAAVWGNRRKLKYNNIPFSLYKKVYEIEDGFIRSVGLGINKIRPMSLLIDSSSIHFDRERNSELEQMINNYKPSESEGVRVQRCVSFIKKYGIDKYNLSQDKVELILDPLKENILVIGQVDSDDSIKYACSNKITSNELVYLVKKKHPQANIIYRPHPEVLRNLQSEQENYLTLKKVCFIDESQSSLSSLLSCDALQTVYTISSLSGFESLLYQKNVVVYGSPFYAGWGLTKDIETNDKGIASFSDLFYCAYIKYPIYMCPLFNEKITIEEALIIIVCIREGILGEGSKDKNNKIDCEELLKVFDISLLGTSRAIKLLREV